MKTTLEIPNILYKNLKIRAAQQGKTIREVVIKAVEHELAVGNSEYGGSAPTYWSCRQPTAEYQALQQNGALAAGISSTDILSEERSGRQ